MAGTDSTEGLNLMVVIRPIALKDLDQLCVLATQTGFGLTTLPRDADLLSERIQESQASFQRMSRRPRGETYLFVMEDLATHQVVGTCGIVSKVGGFEPFYAYKVETEQFDSEMLNVHKSIRTLHLVEDHNGPCEIGSLFLAPSHRRGGNGRLLSLSRFVFMAQHRQRFDPLVIAEMRGVIDDRGRSAFWDAIGKHFFEIDFPKADYLSMVNKKFIADLMPKHPIYSVILPPEAQAVIGEVHEDTRPALKMLRDEGFALSGMVDIFEAGPVVQCARDAIRTVRQTSSATLVEITESPVNSIRCVVGTTADGFRACVGDVERIGESGIRLDAEAAAALAARPGDLIAFAPLRPEALSAQETHDVADESLHRQPVD